MLHRADPNLVTEGEVVLAKQEIGGDTWRGVELRAGAALAIPDVRRFISFRAFPDNCGWMVETPARLSAKLSFRDHETREELAVREFSGPFQPVMLPWPRARFGALDLRVDALGSGKGSIFLANHRALSRDWLVELAVGKGVEIGPGPQPQILPRPGVDVAYVEQMPPEQWNETYNKSGKYPVRPELWGNYVVGDASDLPVPDGSLDFIFGSHVFEHLVNPIGHLQAWKRKLAPAGKVICVVPDLAGTKDALQERSTLEQWQQEYERKLWHPTPAHYARYLRVPVDHELVGQLMERQESTHAHFYDNINCQLLLDAAVCRLGYADYFIEHTPNHKDFHFVLRNR